MQSDVRAKIVELWAAGYNMSEIARRVGLCRSTVAGHLFAQERTRTNAWRVQRKQVIKEKLVRYLGGKCRICGYKKYVGALDFHHKDPGEKEFRISRCSSFERGKREVEKCVLLCSNCHREVEAGVTKFDGGAPVSI